MQYNNRFVYPNKSFIGKLLNFLLNNILFIKAKRFIFYPFTNARLKSDIKNVVYLNWMVPIEKVEHLIPEHVKIKCYDNKVLLTALTYCHGNFRPTAFNKIKYIFGSPLQSNWRLYIANNETFEVNEPTVLFVKNTISSFVYTIGSRVFSNILQSHLPKEFKHINNQTHIITEIIPGESNSPDLKVILNPKSNWQLNLDFKSTFSTVENLLNTICKQEFAISDQPDNKKYSVAKINLKFNNTDVQPLEVESFESKWLKNIVTESDCFAFIIKDLSFLTLGEKIVTIEDK